MLDPAALLEKHRGRAVFLDSNLLVLFLIGSVNRDRIANFKRTQNFTVEDFEVLNYMVNWFGGRLVATPHVLSQVSDLTTLHGSEGEEVRDFFRTTVQMIDERYDAAVKLVDHPAFSRFGLGDSSVAAVCERDILVVTADVRLQLALATAGLDAINFNHVRRSGWPVRH